MLSKKITKAVAIIGNTPTKYNFKIYNTMGNTYKCNTKNSSPKNLKELGELFISLSDKYKLIEIEHKHKETDYFQKIIITIDEK